MKDTPPNSLGNDGPRAGQPGRGGGALTIPNVLSAIRLAGSPFLIVLAVMDRPGAFLVLFIALSVTDWIDGKLAIALDQRTRLGAVLDSIGDACMYAGLLFGAVWLKGDVLWAELLAIGSAVGTYVVAAAAGLAKFKRLPAYHTRSAKTAWLLVFVAAVALFAGWSVWPLRLAMLAVAIANLESLLITILLPQWRVDVPSVFHTRSRNTS